MFDGRVEDLTLEERLNYFRHDEYTIRLLKTIRSMHPETKVRILAMDFYRELKDDYMVYVVTGLTKPEMLEVARKVEPSYTFDEGDLENTHIHLIWGSTGNLSEEFLELTNLEV